MSTDAGQSQRFGSRARLDDVLTWIDASVPRLPSEDVRLADSAGRVVAADIRAPSDLPLMARAAIDGFAVRADETIGASAYNPLVFRLWSAAAGMPAGHAARVSAGDPIPQGADAVAAWDRMTGDDGLSCSVVEAVIAGAWIEPAGSHAKRGDMLVPAGRRMRPDDIGILALAGTETVPVVRRPRVRCLLAGRAVIEAGEPAPSAAHDANGPLLRALVERDGGLVCDRQWIGRATPALRDALAVPGADIILVAGGSRPGPDDHAAAALAAAGQRDIHGVALRFAETIGTGRTAAGIPVIVLPGTPAACLLGYELVAGRAIRQLGGRNPDLPFPTRRMATARKIVSEIGMTEVCPVRCLSDGTVTPLPSFAEAGLAASTQSDGFVLIPETSEGHPQGAPVMVYLNEDVGRS